MSEPIITYRRATSLSLPYYFTGKPCPRCGQKAKRETETSLCLGCKEAIVEQKENIALFLDKPKKQEKTKRVFTKAQRDRINALAREKYARDKSEGAIRKNTKNKDYYQKNKERLKQKRREYYKNNPEKLKLINNKYREKNREKIRIANKKYQEDNKEKMKARSREYYRKNKAKILARKREREAKKAKDVTPMKGGKSMFLFQDIVKSGVDSFVAVGPLGSKSVIKNGKGDYEAIYTETAKSN